MRHYHRVTIRPERIAIMLLVMVVVLVVFHLIGHYHRALVGSGFITYSFAPKFDLDGEQTVPAFFSALLLMFAALVLAAIAHDEETIRYRVHWWILGAIFAFLAFDEAASFHELLIMPMRSRFDLPRWLRFAWVIPGAIMVAVFALSYMRFVFHLPRGSAYLFVIAGVLYVGGALGMEVLGAAYGGTGWYQVFMITEETLEMVGIIVFIYALLRHKALFGSSLQVLFEHADSPPAAT